MGMGAARLNITAASPEIKSEIFLFIMELGVGPRLSFKFPFWQVGRSEQRQRAQQKNERGGIRGLEHFETSIVFGKARSQRGAMEMAFAVRCALRVRGIFLHPRK